jgi:hypothetical protein
MMVEAGLLFLLAVGVAWHGSNSVAAGFFLYFMTGIASCAMGLQNATISRISSGNVRTTHVTGVLTDLGLEIGQCILAVTMRFRPQRSNVGPTQDRVSTTRLVARRLALLVSIIGTFALGAGLGTLAHDRVPRWAMFVPVAFLAWIIYQDVKRPIAEIESLNLAGGQGNLSLPTSLAVYHLGKDHDRDGKIHRMPNLLAWTDRLSPEVRVIILNLDGATSLDENAVLELREVLVRLAGQGRQFIVTGRGDDLYRQMRLVRPDNLLKLENICPDLELGIARGLMLVHDQEDQPKTRSNRAA